MKRKSERETGSKSERKCERKKMWRKNERRNRGKTQKGKKCKNDVPPGGN